MLRSLRHELFRVGLVIAFCGGSAETTPCEVTRIEAEQVDDLSLVRVLIYWASVMMVELPDVDDV